MKKWMASLLVLSLLSKYGNAQGVTVNTRDESYVSAPALGVHFLLNDFVSAQRIRAGSLSKVLRTNQLATVKEMYPGVGLTYYKGLLNHIDFAGSLNASFVRMQIGDNSATSSDNNLLLEGDASVNLKMLTDHYVVDPYLIVGIGASKYKGYYGAFMPLGGGIKINFFNEAALIISTQYRVPVTNETANYHFVYSIGIAGILNAKKLQPVKGADIP